MAWNSLALGCAATYVVVFLRLEGLVPLRAFDVGFALFHIALALSIASLIKGPRQGAWMAYTWSSLLVGVYWLAYISVPAFLARFH